MQDAPLPDRLPPRLTRRALGPGTRALLIVLRVYVFIAVPLVCYAFIHALRAPPS